MLVTSFQLFRIEFSFITLTSLVTSTKCEAAVLKFSALVMISSCAVLIARYDAILDQLERENLHNHRNNFTEN